MNDRNEEDYRREIRGLLDDASVFRDKLQRAEARIGHANETLTVAKAVNDAAAQRIAKLELELSGERSKNRTVAIQMELLVATNLGLRERLEKHEKLDPPEQALKATNREEQKLEKVPGSDDYYFDRDLQNPEKQAEIRRRSSGMYEDHEVKRRS